MHIRFTGRNSGINARESFGNRQNFSVRNMDAKSESTSQPGTPRLSDKWLTFWKADFHGKLLLVLIALLLTWASIGGTTIGLVTVDALLFLISWVTATVFFHHHKKKFGIYVSLAMIASIVDAASEFAKGTPLAVILRTIAGVGFAGLLIAAIVILFIKLSRVRRVSIDTVYGGICVYLLLGFLWYIFYALIAVFDPAAFEYAYLRTGAYDLMYFSLNTLTTLGQGDIVPLNRFSMVLCNLEALVGQIFPSVFIARLVSLYVVNELEDREAKKSPPS
jgi:hypothetical protein